MISIRNSLDMTRAEREEALREVLALGFCPGGGAGAAELAAAVQAARAGSLPQFFFLFEGERLRGYCFCIAEREGYSPALPWWAVHNAEELADELARPLLRAGAERSAACGAAELSCRLRGEEAARA